MSCLVACKTERKGKIIFIEMVLVLFIFPFQVGKCFSTHLSFLDNLLSIFDLENESSLSMLENQNLQKISYVIN